ncbi:MAG: hypothetical protein ABS79_06295 [Planctomycetes bacterium SCN 63-9]|nr:MAG: hypothetical protein ABS79_06295 [Planctomycetes bacterium SCN 63-9]
MKHVFAMIALGTLCVTAVPRLSAREVEFSLRSRDAEGKPMVTKERIDPGKIGIVVVDMWNFHWCKTATMRVAALVPRMNRVLNVARDQGMTVMLCPSDVVDNYVGWPQREKIFSMPRHTVPPLQKIECPNPPNGGGCACGRERCVVNYGWDGMHPDLAIADDDLMPDTLEDVYSICKERGLTHLIYFGVHTQVCLLGKPMGLRNLKSAGLKCILARDLTDAHPGYKPEIEFTPDKHTAEVVEHFERYLAPSVDMTEEVKKQGLWNTKEAVDPVRITPWGTRMRPHLFEKDVVVTLTAPRDPDAEIRYTADPSRPIAEWNVYTRPLTLSETTQLTAFAFRGGAPISTKSEGSFAKLSEIPPKPDRHLSDLTPVRAVGPGHSYNNQTRFSAHSNPPRKDRSNEDKVLRLRRQDYAKGIGVHAPCQLMYELRPEYKRFVALAGVDEHLLEVASGSNVAKYPSVVFKVFIDGREAAASPVMRVATLPWRFDVPIPANSRSISLVATDAGDGNREDLANWVDAGFVVSER